MNERDQLLAQLKDLRAQAEDITQRAAELIAEEDRERRRHHWTPVVIRGGLAGAAAAWFSSLARGALKQHPVTTASVTIATAGATIGVMLAPVVRQPPQAVPPPDLVEPPITRSPTSTSSLPTLTTTNRGARVPTLPPPTSVATTSPPSQSTGLTVPEIGAVEQPPSISAPTGPPVEPPVLNPFARCVIRVDVDDIAEMCVGRGTNRPSLYLDGPEGV